MPVVNIPNLGPVSFPEGMSEKQIRAEAQRMADAISEKLTYKPDYRDLGIGQLMYGGFRRAASGLGSTVTDLLPALAGAAFGQDEYARQQLEEAAQKQKEIRERFPTAVPSYKDIRGVGDVPEYIAESLGELTPDILAMLTGAGTVGALGRRAAVKGVEKAAATRAAETAAKRQMDEAAAAAYADRLKQRAVARQADEIAKTKDLAQGTGLYGVSLGLNAPDTFESIYEKTGSLEPGIALAFGSAQAALDSILPAQILKQFSPAVKARAAAELVEQSTVVPQSVKVGVAKELAKTGASEAGTESVQELLGILAERTAGAPGEVFSTENIDRMIDAGLKGLIGGTAFGAPGAVAKARREAVPAPEAEPTAPVPPTAEAPPALTAPVPPTPLPPTPEAAPVAPVPSAMEGAPRVESVLPELVEETTPTPAPEAPPVVAGIDVSQMATAALQKRLQLEINNPREQSDELITAITDELLRRSAEKGEPRAKTAAPTTPEPTTAPAPQPPIERPVAAPAGESVSVPSGPPTGGAPTGVEAPESGAVVRRGESVEPPTAGAAVQPPTLEPAAPPPPPPPPPPPTPTAVPEGVSRETLIEDMRQIIAGKQSLMIKGSRAGMRAPFANSPARKKFDALDAQLAEKKQQWRDLTGEELDVNLLGFNPDGTLAPTAPPLPPAPAPVTTEAPTPTTAPAPTPEVSTTKRTPESFAADIAAGKKLDTPEDVQFYQNNAAAIEAELKKLAPKQEEPKKRGRPKKVLTEEETKAKAEREAEKEKRKTEREAAKKAAEEERQRLKGLVIKGPKGETLTPEEVDQALKNQERAAAVFKEVESGGYRPTRKDSLERTDSEILLGLLGTKRELAKDAAAAKAYFSKTGYSTNALYDIAFDLTHPGGRYRKGIGEGTVEAQRFSGTGTREATLAAEWVRKSNLSDKAKSIFEQYVTEHKQSASRTRKGMAEYSAKQEQQRAYEEAAKQTPKAGLVAGLQATEAELRKQQGDAAEKDKQAAQRREQSKKELRKRLGSEKAVREALGKAFAEDELLNLEAELDVDVLKLDAAGQFALPLHPVVRQSLMQGDLKQALRFLAADYGKGPITDLARLYERVLTTTDVVTVNELTDESGRRVPGYYDPKINTVFLDSVDGMNSHVLFHELGHALTSHVLANPSHPVTRQLTQLFNDVKDSLDTAYGATNLDEFVAETWANDDFKGKLNSINPKGEKITAWQRFVNAIRNLFRSFMGRPTVSIETAFDRADKAIQAIVSNAPESRDAELLYAAVVNPRAPFINATLNSMTQAVSALPGVNSAQGQKTISNAHEFFKNTLGKTGRNILNSLLPLDAYTDMVEQVLPGARRVNELVNEKHGDEGMRNASLEPTVTHAENWAARTAKISPDLLTRFNNVVYDSTVERIDPTRPRQFYEDKFAQASALDLQNALETWDRLNAELKAVDSAAPGAVKLYNLMRNTYMEFYNEIVSSIGARIDDSVTDPQARKKIKNELFTKLMERGSIDPYFPLTRNGDYWLRYEAKDRFNLPNLYVEAFETERERNQAVAELEKLQAQGEVSNIQRFSNISELSYRNTPPTSFVNGILKTLEAQRIDIKDPDDVAKFDRAMESVMRMYLTTLPETSFAQSFQRRKDRMGFSKDSIRAFREKTYSLSRQLSNMKYAAKLYAEGDKMRAYVRKLAEEGKVEDNKVAKEYLDELQKRIEFAAAPTVSRWAQLATTFGFNYLLGFNVSSALINMTQIPMIVMPYLGGRYGYSQANKAIAEATKVYTSSGFTRIVEMMGSGGEKVKVKAMPSLDNYDFDAKDTPEHVKKYKTLAEVAAKMGQLNRSQLYDILEVDGRKNPVAAVNAVGGFAFHHAERMNRQVALMAAYNLELERLKKDDPRMDQKEREVRAAQAAISMTETTNGGVSAASAPRIAQNSLGRVLFMFKRYGVSMYYMLFKMTREIMQNQDPEVRKAAFKQLAGVYGTTALISGLQGVPMFGVLAMVYNMLKDDDEENFASVVRGYTGESVYKGLINSATGLSVAERTGLSDLLFRDSPYSSGSTSLAESFAQLLGGPVYGVASRIQRGWGMLMDGETVRGIESMVPVAVANGLKSMRYATEGANTLRGDPIVGDIGPWNIAAQFLGFTPAEYTRQLEKNSMLKGIEKAVVQERTKQLRKMYIANRFGDTDGYNEARGVLEELYADHPGLGNLEETIRRSMAQHERTTQKMYHGIVLNQKLEAELTGYVNDWN